MKILIERTDRRFRVKKQIFFTTFLLMTSTAFAGPALRLTLNWKAEPQFGGFLAAQQEGLFKKHGLDVEVQPGGSGTPTLQMLAAGKMEYGVVSGDELLIAAAKGNTPLVAIFATFQKNPQGLMVRQDEHRGSLAEVFQSDDTLLWQEGLPYAQFLKNKYKSHFNVKTAPYPGGISAFLAAKNIVQQCFVNSEPVLSQNQGVPTKVFLAADEGYNPYTTVLAVRRDYLAQHRDEVQRMVQSVKEGWETYLKNPQPTHALISHLNPAMPEALLNQIDAAQIDLIRPKAEPTAKGSGSAKASELGRMTSERWESLAQILFDQHVTKTRVLSKNLFENFDSSP